MKSVGLYFGTFNPIHIGHLAIANYMLEFTAIDELWFVPSPQSPFKTEQEDLLPMASRLVILRRAIKDAKRMKITDIESQLPSPSYTIDTMLLLKQNFPAYDFSILLGADNLERLHRWKKIDLLLKNHRFLVYPRHGFSYSSDTNLPKELLPFSASFQFVDAPKIELTSTFIRAAIKAGKNVRFFLSESVYAYLTEKEFYAE